VKATLQPNGALLLESPTETRLIQATHPRYLALMRLYQQAARIALSAAQAPPAIVMTSPRREARAEPEHIPPPGFGGHPWRRGTPEAGRIYEVPIEALHRDPHRFRYASDATDGIADDDVGVLTVWKDPADGLTYIVTGAHHLDRAECSGDVPTLNCQYIDAKNAVEALAVGAAMTVKDDGELP